MKCEGCGAALSLEEKYCPYCGRENIAAKQHVEDMAHYQGEFEETKKKVYEKTNTYTHNAVKIVVVAILAIVWVVTLVLVGNTYEIKDAISTAKITANYDEMEAQIWEYLENEEYYALSSYCYENRINGYNSPFDHISPVIRLSEQYSYIYEGLLEIITPPTYDIQSMDDKISNLTGYIEYFYDSYNQDWDSLNYDNRYDMSVSQPHMDGMEQQLRMLLQTYAGLTEEEAAQLAKMSKGQRTVILEEGLLNEKE